MKHSQFVAAYKAGHLEAYVPPERAADFLAARMWLPLIRLPILGSGVALALIGWYITGLLVFLLGMFLPRMIKKNAVAILMYQALQDEESYQDFLAAGVLQLPDE
ncbi:MAG: hypothetical protein RLY67_195 [Pseudomonadota bacterium]|jgi:pilus assembly protein TadC